MNIIQSMYSVRKIREGKNDKHLLAKVNSKMLKIVKEDKKLFANVRRLFTNREELRDTEVVCFCLNIMTSHKLPILCSPLIID